MPDLDFQITGVAPAARGLTPLLQFDLRISATPASARIHAIILQAQIQFQPERRTYTPRERERLVDLFGRPEDWGRTLQGRLWTHAQTATGSFEGTTEAQLPVPCSYDFNVAATKYFYALEDGDVPLLFLFSGTVFYCAPEGHLQVHPIARSAECTYRMPATVWQQLMDTHYPGSAWIYLERNVFDQLYAFKRRHSIPTWEQTVERLLSAATPAEVAP